MAFHNIQGDPEGESGEPVRWLVEQGAARVEQRPGREEYSR